MNTDPYLYRILFHYSISILALNSDIHTQRALHTSKHVDGISIAIFTCYQNTITILILLTYPLKPLRLLIGDAVVVAEFSVDNVKSVAGIKMCTTKGRKRKKKTKKK